MRIIPTPIQNVTVGMEVAIPVWPKWSDIEGQGYLTALVLVKERNVIGYQNEEGDIIRRHFKTYVLTVHR